MLHACCVYVLMIECVSYYGCLPAMLNYIIAVPRLFFVL